MPDGLKNFALATVSIGYSSSATSIVLVTGHGAKLPAVPFNATWWNADEYSNPSDDPNVEIVRVTAKATDTLTIARAQEGTSASAKNTSGRTYKLGAFPTKKTFDDRALNADIQTFTTPGVQTWTKPAGAKVVVVKMIGGGGGGEGGPKGSAISGASGAGAGYAEQTFDASLLGATESVTVAAGGTGGTAASSADTTGLPGGNGGDSIFGAFLKAPGGGGGGQTGTAVGGVAVDIGPMDKGGNGVAPGSTGGNSNRGGAGGGPQSFSAGGSSGVNTLPTPLICPPGFGSISGQSAPAGLVQGGAGGRGGGNFFGGDYSGGQGGKYGGGGGGGTTGANTFTPGDLATNGGPGGDGIVQVITYF